AGKVGKSRRRQPLHGAVILGAVPAHGEGRSVPGRHLASVPPAELTAAFPRRGGSRLVAARAKRPRRCRNISLTRAPAIADHAVEVVVAADHAGEQAERLEPHEGGTHTLLAWIHRSIHMR